MNGLTRVWTTENHIDFHGLLYRPEGTHHMPIIKTGEEYMSDPLTGAFCNRHNSLVKASGAKYWIAGHTHFPGQVKIDKTLVVNNSCGYPGEKTGFDNQLILET